jgi:hypothetical protein
LFVIVATRGCFSHTVSDGHGGTATAMVHITLQ